MNIEKQTFRSGSRSFGLLLIFLISGFFPLAAWAQETTSQFGGHDDHPTLVLAFLGIIVVMAKIAGAFAERFKQVPVLGELVLGVLLGVPALFGMQHFELLKTDDLVLFVSEIAIIILLFQAGLESNLHEMKRVGLRAVAVAIIGVVAPFFLGACLVSPLIFPEASSKYVHLFVGATMTATSVGITARVFKDLNIAQTPSAKIVLGAAVLDDVIGLLILAVVNGIVKSGEVSAWEIGVISLKAFAFLWGSIALGRLLTPAIGYGLSRLHRGVGMKMALALAFAFGYAYLGSLFGLAPIVGAFAAGLILDEVHFKRFYNFRLTTEIEKSLVELPDSSTTDKIRASMTQYSERHVEHLIEVFGQWFVPVFFVVTGMSIDLYCLANPRVLFAAIILTIVAVIGKVVSGWVAGKDANWKIVGFGMVPRGEVGLIFASIAKATGVIDSHTFTALVIMIILTTFITPIILPKLIDKASTTVDNR